MGLSIKQCPQKYVGTYSYDYLVQAMSCRMWLDTMIVSNADFLLVKRSLRDVGRVSYECLSSLFSLTYPVIQSQNHIISLIFERPDLRCPQPKLRTPVLNPHVAVVDYHIHRDHSIHHPRQPHKYPTHACIRAVSSSTLSSDSMKPHRGTCSGFLAILITGGGPSVSGYGSGGGTLPFPLGFEMCRRAA